MDEQDDILPNHLFISLRHQFKATRIIEQRITPTTIQFKIDLSTNERESEDEDDEYGTRFEVALAKINYFVSNILDNCIIANIENQWAQDSFMDGQKVLLNNTMMLCPEEPTDALLAELILCKFKALAKDAFNFHAIDIESTDGRNMGFTFVGGRPGVDLPQGEEWLTTHNYFSKPWWSRDDASTLDVIPEEDADLNLPPEWSYSLGFIADQFANSEAPTGKVVRPEFKPQIITGGKED